MHMNFMRSYTVYLLHSSDYADNPAFARQVDRFVQPLFPILGLGGTFYHYQRGVSRRRLKKAQVHVQ